MKEMSIFDFEYHPLEKLMNTYNIRFYVFFCLNINSICDYSTNSSNIINLTPIVIGVLFTFWKKKIDLNQKNQNKQKNQ